MKTIFHAYHFDTTKPDEAAAYKELCARLTAAGLKCFNTWGGTLHYMPDLDGRTLDLEIEHLFENQWNTAPTPENSKLGRRVFDWAQDYPINIPKTIKRGYYLDITAEMREIRRNTKKCRYCGAHEPAAKGYVFCPHCIGSQYLKASELHLTRMKAIDDQSDCEPLTQAEHDHLLPQYKDAQLHGHTDRDRKRIAKARADVIQKAAKETKDAATERDGFLWFMDKGIRTDNLIYYNHTGRFCFGWRQPVDDELRSAVLDVVSEFPFPYDLKLADGRTLSGGVPCCA